jgi:hypothetical protein
METLIASKNLIAEVITAFDVTGREHLVIAVKASWKIPQAGQRPRPIAPVAVALVDDFYGEQGESALRYGADICRFKPNCDVLFDAKAHSPDGHPVCELIAGFRVGQLQKEIRVIGSRQWRKNLGVFSLTQPEYFLSMPLHYGLAFGGTRTYQQGNGSSAQKYAEALPVNPAGLGWAGSKTKSIMDGMPAPCLEALDDPISSPTGNHQSTAFSAVARHWQPRPQYGGTYGEDWLRDVCPFLPEDFDERYHQCAHSDQQMPYPKGGEEVVLMNMMPKRGRVSFKLPKLDNMQVRVLRKDYSVDMPKAVVDTLFFEPELERFSAVWRASVPIKRRIQEFDTLAIGPVDLAWWQNKTMGIDGEGCIGCNADYEQAEMT